MEIFARVLAPILRIQILIGFITATAQPVARTAPLPPVVDPASYSALRYRYIGPPGNRTDAVVGIPGDPAIYYAGSQLEALLARIPNDPAEPGLRSAAQALNGKFADLAERLQQQKQVAFFEWPVELPAKFVYLVNHVQSSDRQPTDQASEAYAYLQDELRLVNASWDSLTQKDLIELNTRLERQGLPILLTTRQ